MRSCNWKRSRFWRCRRARRLLPAFALPKFTQLTSSWNAMACAKRLHCRRRKPPRPLHRKPRHTLSDDLRSPLFHNHKLQNLLLLKSYDRLIGEAGDPLVNKMTVIETHDFQIMSPSVFYGAAKDHL
ncbi:exported protein of unknown function [Georgfuchsia toluolica]|uniref:Uncharacterized protein n=1 Tax=Georgfuchsia toluolica TaxID=424218 RepID=A0A916N270_9PROT|nr:exported protein of unknown function [Georgfuchsia toluolica]